nr:hypothetical protein Iba_chr08cCG8780 [Ipomoea batatas]
MGTKSIFAATRPDEIDRVYRDKLAGRDIRKGKGQAVDDDESTPTERGFVDRNPRVGTSREADQIEGSDNSSNQAEDAPNDADESTESSSSNDSGDEATNQMQVVIYAGEIDPTPLPRKDGKLSRVVEENDTPRSLT